MLRSRRDLPRRRNTPDRAFRALAREDPARIVALFRLALPGLMIPGGARITPAHVDDPTVDATPAPLSADLAVRIGRFLLVHSEFQAYRSLRFLRRLFRYHLGFVERYPDRRVESIAVWVIRPPGSYQRNEISHGNVTIRIRTLVLAELSAEILLANPLSACFAAGADRGSLSEEELCCRVVEALRAGEAAGTSGGWRALLPPFKGGTKCS